MTNFNKSQKDNMVTSKRNKRFISFVVKENTPEAIWLNNQNNKSDSMRLAINVCIRLFGSEDVFQRVKTINIDSINEPNIPEKVKNFDLDHDRLWKYFKMNFKQGGADPYLIEVN